MKISGYRLAEILKKIIEKCEPFREDKQSL